jgi:large conductance mechanosensitive channel
MIKEFKEFAFKGNLIDMAVGIIIGGAFATVVKSLVDNVFMPPLGMLLGRVDFSELTIPLQKEVREGGTVVTPAVSINYGQFLTDLVSFLLLALVVFIVIKKVIVALKTQLGEPGDGTPAAAPPRQEVLLEEIRDLLKERAGEGSGARERP